MITFTNILSFPQCLSQPGTQDRKNTGKLLTPPLAGVKVASLPGNEPAASGPSRAPSCVSDAWNVRPQRLFAEKPEQRTVQPDWRAGNSLPPAPPLSQTSPASTFNFKQAKEPCLPGKEANPHESPKTSQTEGVRGWARLVSPPGGQQSPGDNEPSAKGPRGGRWVYPHLCRAPSQVSWAAGGREVDRMFCGSQVWVAGPATCSLSNLSLVIQALPASSMSKGSHSLLEGLLEGLKTACTCVKFEWQRPSVPAGLVQPPLPW